jgi:hypothetical protein
MRLDRNSTLLNKVLLNRHEGNVELLKIVVDSIIEAEGNWISLGNMYIQGRQSIPKSGGGGTDSKLGRSGGMLPEIFFLILVH